MLFSVAKIKKKPVRKYVCKVKTYDNVNGKEEISCQRDFFRQKMITTPYYFFLNWRGDMPKCSFTYLPKKEALGNPNWSEICLMLRSLCFR